MPTNAFFKLEKEKQEELLKSAREEFGKSLISEVSINKIIQKIGMPRGTFYLYFENKEDLYFYLLGQMKERGFAIAKELLDQHHGDLIMTMISIFDCILKETESGEQADLIKYTILNMNYRMEQTLYHRPPFTKKIEVEKYIDFSKLNIEKEEITSVFHILMTITLHAFNGIFVLHLDKEEVRQHYMKELEIIQKGIRKN